MLKQTGFLKANYWFWHNIKWIFNPEKCYRPAITWGVGPHSCLNESSAWQSWTDFKDVNGLHPKAPWNIHFSSAIKFSGIVVLRLAISSGMKMPRMWNPAWFAAAKNPSLLRRIRSVFWTVKVSELSQQPWATIFSALSASWLQCFQEDWEASWLAFSAEVNSVCHVSTLLWLC